MNTMENKKIAELLEKAATDCGAYRAKVISTELIETDASFRDMCAMNSCGVYGKCWMCPPDVGDIEKLMSDVKSYDFALVYQSVSELEDSFDFEGMIEAKKRSYSLQQKVRAKCEDMPFFSVLYLGSGGCGVCETCSKVEGKPCRHPKLATPSLEAYGINVSQLASASEMKYINGKDTVTYFGAVLFSMIGEGI